MYCIPTSGEYRLAPSDHPPRLVLVEGAGDPGEFAKEVGVFEKAPSEAKAVWRRQAGSEESLLSPGAGRRKESALGGE
jgi:hypothetical protein